MAESLLVGRNFVSGICKLKPKNLNIYLKTFKNIYKKTYVLPAVPTAGAPYSVNSCTRH